MVLLMELKGALSTCEFELQSLRHQYEALNPGKVNFILNAKVIISHLSLSYQLSYLKNNNCNFFKTNAKAVWWLFHVNICYNWYINVFQTLTIPAQILSSNNDQDGNKQGPSEIIDVVGSPGTPSVT